MEHFLDCWVIVVPERHHTGIKRVYLLSHVKSFYEVYSS